MTVGELRALLADLPDDAPVVVDGCSGGLDVALASFGTTRPCSLAFKSGFEGEFDDLTDVAGDVKPGDFAVVYINSDRHGYADEFKSYAEALEAVQRARNDAAG